MSRAPTPEEISALLRMPGARPPDAGLASDAGLSVALSGPGARHGDAQRRRQLTEAVNANAYIHARLLDARARYANDADDATLGQRWAADADKIVEDGLAKVSSERLRNRLRSDIAAPLVKERAAIEAQAFRGVAAAHAQTREQYLRHLIQNVGTDPNDPLLTGGIHAYHATIDNARDRGLVTPVDALAEKRRAALALCEAEYAGMARRDPARAIRELHGEAKGHPLLAHLPPERKDALVDEARQRQTANATDVELAAQRRHEQGHRASDEAEAAIISDLLGENPSVTSGAILDNPALSAPARERMLGAAARTGRPEPDPEISKSTAVGLLSRIRRPDGDGDKITTIAPLVEAYDRGALSRAGFRFVAKQFADSGTPEAATIARYRQAFVDSMEASTRPAPTVLRQDGQEHPNRTVSQAHDHRDRNIAPEVTVADKE